MQIRHIAVLATVLAGALTAGPAFAQMKMSSPGAAQEEATASRPGDVWTGGGIFFAPRYLDNPGEFELGLGPTYMVGSDPGKLASPFGFLAGVDYKISDSLEVAVLAGPVTLAGLRGPISENEFGSVGWALLYRGDLYPVGYYATKGDATTYTKPAGLPQGLTALPFPDGIGLAQGGELRIDGMQKLGPINLFAVPRLAVMSNGTRVGLGLGLDLDFDRIVVGGNWSSALNITPASSPMNTFENQYGAGGRVILTDALYLVASYIYIPADAYGNNISNVVSGIGYRFGEGKPTGGMKMSQ